MKTSSEGGNAGGSRNRRIRRACRRGLVLLLIGSLVTVAVAWTSAALVPFPSSFRQARASGLSRAEWWITSRKSTFAGVRFHSTVMIRAQQYEERDDLGELPAWADLPEPEATGRTGANNHYEIADARGWPFVCLYSRFSAEQVAKAKQVKGDVIRGISLGTFEDSAWYDPRVLPVGPIWLGLMADASFYALLIGSLWLGGGVVRRAVRRRKGLCIQCGYSLAGAGHERCPECGEGLASRIRRWLAAVGILPVGNASAPALARRTRLHVSRGGDSPILRGIRT